LNPDNGRRRNSETLKRSTTSTSKVLAFGPPLPQSEAVTTHALPVSAAALTLHKAAALTGHNVRMLKAAILSGDLPAMRIGRGPKAPYLIAPADLWAWDLSRVAPVEAKRQEWASQVLRGRCHVPGCSDPNCPIAYGLCHCGCGSVTALAPQSSSRLQLVCGEPHRYVKHHEARARFAEQNRNRHPVHGKRAALAAFKAAHRLLDTDDLAKRLDRSRGSAEYYARAYGIGTRFPGLGGPHGAILFTEAEADLIAQRIAAARNGLLWRDGERRGLWENKRHHNPARMGNFAKARAERNGRQVGRPRDWVPGLERDLLVLFHQSLTQAAIARRLGLSRQQVARELNRQGLTTRRRVSAG